MAIPTTTPVQCTAAKLGPHPEVEAGMGKDERARGHGTTGKEQEGELATKRGRHFNSLLSDREAGNDG